MQGIEQMLYQIEISGAEMPGDIACLFDLRGLTKTIVDENADFGHCLAPSFQPETAPVRAVATLHLVESVPFASDSVRGAREIDLGGEGNTPAATPDLAGGLFDEATGTGHPGDALVTAQDTAPQGEEAVIINCDAMALPYDMSRLDGLISVAANSNYPGPGLLVG